MSTIEQRKLDQRERERKIADANTRFISTAQVVKGDNSRYLPSTNFTLEGEMPQIMLHESDTHYGHLAADNDGWQETFNYVMAIPGASIGFFGDILEGYNPSHVDSNNQIVLEPTEQILSFQDKYLQPLSDQGKIVEMIGLYTNSHLRAAVKVANIDPYPLLTHGLPIPLLYNGSIFYLSRGKQSIAMRGFHNPPTSGRNNNPTAGLDTSETNMPGYATHVIAGHLHTLGSAVSAQKNREGGLQYRYSLGARKGRNTGTALPDRFAISTNGGKISGPPGAATILYETKNGLNSYGIGDTELAKTMYRAATLYTRIQDRGQEQEFRDRISSDFSSQATYQKDEKRSKKRIEERDTEAKERLTDSWKKLFFIVESEAPLLFMFASGLRFDSNLANTKQLKEVVDLVTSNPFAALFVLRQMVDVDVPQHANRRKVVQDVVKMVRPAWEKHQLLAWEFDSILRYEYWKHPKDKLPNGAYSDPEGFMPATYITETTGVPMVDNEAEIIFAIQNKTAKSPAYRMKIFDKPGSPRSAFSGMLNNEASEGYNIEGGEHDLLVGGNSTSGGWLQRSNPKIGEFQTVISPGWMAHEHTVGYKGKRSIPSAGGYGAILLADQKKIIPVSTVEEARYWHAAMYFLMIEKMSSYRQFIADLNLPPANSQRIKR